MEGGSSVAVVVAATEDKNTDVTGQMRLSRAEAAMVVLLVVRLRRAG
jgi:hypothetical protein